MPASQLAAWPFLVAVVLLASLSMAGLAQSDEEKTRVQLQQLQRDIKRINREISSASARRSTLQQQLRIHPVLLNLTC